MYILTQSQAFWPSMSFLLFFAIFIIATIRSLRLRREDTDEWSKMALDDNEKNQNKN